MRFLLSKIPSYTKVNFIISSKTSCKRQADLSKLPVETVAYALAEGEKVCVAAAERCMK